MTSRKIPSPKDIKDATQAAAETAQSIASGAMRIPPASIELATQLPALLENLATATQRLNEAIDRGEALPRTGRSDDSDHGRASLPSWRLWSRRAMTLSNAVSSIPGVSTLGRIATRGSKPATPKRTSSRRSGT